MTNKEAIEYGKKWDEALESRGDTPFSEARQFLNLAIYALKQMAPVKIEVTEHHTFAVPDDVEDLDFPSVSSEDK